MNTPDVVIPNSDPTLTALFIGMDTEDRIEVDSYPIFAWKVYAATSDLVPIIAGSIQHDSGSKDWAVVKDGICYALE